MALADAFTVNKQTQFGVESTPGLAVPANKLLASMDVSLDPQFNVLKYKGAGRRFQSVIVPDGQESVSGKISGAATFTEFVYAASMIWGAATISTPATAVNARQWKWVVPLSGRVNPKTMTVEQGDSDDASRVTNGILTDLGLALTRAKSDLTGSFLGTALQKAGGAWAGMTASPTPIPLVPVVPVKWSAYLDTSPQGSGAGTKLTRCFGATFDYGGAFIPYFPMDAALTSYAGVADSNAVAATLILSLMSDPLVGEALFAAARAAQTRYMRVLANGDSAENFKTISVAGVPTGGTFTVVYGGQTSGAISWNATAVQVQPILDAMTSLGPGQTAVSGGPLPGTALRIDMKGSLLNDPATNVFTLGTNSLTGGTTPAPAFAAPVQIPSSLQIDVAGKVTKPAGQADMAGVRVRDWTFEMVEDPTMNAGAGGSIIVTVVNSLTAL